MPGIRCLRRRVAQSPALLPLARGTVGALHAPLHLDAVPLPSLRHLPLVCTRCNSPRGDLPRLHRHLPRPACVRPGAPLSSRGWHRCLCQSMLPLPETLPPHSLRANQRPDCPPQLGVTPDLTHATTQAVFSPARCTMVFVRGMVVCMSVSLSSVPVNEVAIFETFR